MKNFLLKIKDVKKFMKDEKVLYAANERKKFFILLHAGPNVDRYVVSVDGDLSGFTKINEAVKFFNGS